MSQQNRAALFKNKSWSPDIQREEAWLKRKKIHRARLAVDRRSLSLSSADDRRRYMSLVANNDVEELRACFELGFGFDSDSDLDHKLTKAFPALELYQAVNKQHNKLLSRSSSCVSTITSRCETPSSVESSVSIVESGDEPEKVKMRLKQWAQMVAISVRRSSSF